MSHNEYVSDFNICLQVMVSDFLLEQLHNDLFFNVRQRFPFRRQIRYFFRILHPLFFGFFVFPTLMTLFIRKTSGFFAAGQTQYFTVVHRIDCSWRGCSDVIHFPSGISVHSFCIAWKGSVASPAMPVTVLATFTPASGPFPCLCDHWTRELHFIHLKLHFILNTTVRRSENNHENIRPNIHGVCGGVKIDEKIDKFLKFIFLKKSTDFYQFCPPQIRRNIWKSGFFSFVTRGNGRLSRVWK